MIWILALLQAATSTPETRINYIDWPSYSDRMKVTVESTKPQVLCTVYDGERKAAAMTVYTSKGVETVAITVPRGANRQNTRVICL